MVLRPLWPKLAILHPVTIQNMRCKRKKKNWRRIPLKISTHLVKCWQSVGGVLAERWRLAKYCGGKICQQAVLSPIHQVYSSVTALNSPLITKSHLFRPFILIWASPSQYDMNNIFWVQLVVSNATKIKINFDYDKYSCHFKDKYFRLVHDTGVYTTGVLRSGPDG